MRRLKHLKLFEEFSYSLRESQSVLVFSNTLRKRLNNILKLSKSGIALTLASDLLDLENKTTKEGITLLDVYDSSNRSVGGNEEEFFVMTASGAPKPVKIFDFFTNILSQYTRFKYKPEEIDIFIDAYVDFKPHYRIAA